MIDTGVVVMMLMIDTGVVVMMLMMILAH